MNDLYCPQCRNVIAPSDINAREGVAKCGRCGEVFRGEQSSPEPPQPALPRPAGIIIVPKGEELLIVRRWFNPIWFIFLVMCPIFPILGIKFFAEIYRPEHGIALNGLCALLHFGVPLAFLYMSLAQLINRTEIRVDRRQMMIWNGPLPFTRNRTIEVTRINQLYCGMENGGEDSSVTYGVYLVMKGGDRQPLCKGMRAQAQAQYIEQAIEQHLGIANRPVVGEIGS